MPELPPPELIASGKYLRLLARGHWEYADRVGTTGAVAIVAVTNERRLVLVEQFRIPLGKAVIELPAGLVGDSPEHEDEPLAATARRELLEETGYEAAEMYELNSGPTSAGLSTEVMAFFYATGLRKVQDGGGIEHEQITVHEVPLAELLPWLRRAAADGLAIDPKIFAGVYLAENIRS
jgi:ADP-ribose pyrophosphatase